VIRAVVAIENYSQKQEANLLVAKKTFG